jgi:hypothetical protein
MWAVVVILLVMVVFGWKRREGYTNPADEAEKQSGDLRYTQKKFESIGTLVSEDELDKFQVQVTKHEEKVNDLDVKMRTLLETKRVNDTKGYPKT